ncbi:MAG: hypothetical protein HQK66_08405 [Desulfamplus sp.]|nr:hypothetical protein [Desulfamplus sp.]
MKQDPFGNLADWGPVLNLIESADNDSLVQYQPGLIRILRYQANWRLREAVLKRAGDIYPPSSDLVLQILDMLDNDNIYYDARILACEAMVQLLKKSKKCISDEIICKIKTVLERLNLTPHPPFFQEALTRAASAIIGNG